MKGETAFFSALIILCLVTISGCLQDPVSPADPGPATTFFPPPYTSLALTADDVPDEFSLAQSRQKERDEVGDLARDMGWSGGYVVSFTGYPDNPLGPTTITQTIATYPASRMPEILAYIRVSDRSDQEMGITDLPAPDIGDESFAFIGKPSSQIVLRPKTGDPLAGNTLQGSLRQDVVEVVFSQGSTLEVLKMSGPHADAGILLDLAKKASGRIPGSSP